MKKYRQCDFMFISGVITVLATTLALNIYAGLYLLGIALIAGAIFVHKYL